MNSAKWVLSVATALFLGGCATGTSKFSDSGIFLPSPKDVQKMLLPKVSNEDIIKQSPDKELSETFLTNTFEKVTAVEHGSKTIILEKKWLYETDSFIRYSKSRSFYRGLAHDFLNDDVAKAYMETIIKRGSGYVIYNGSGNEMLMSAYAGGNPRRSSDTSVFAYDSDFAIVEYDKEGNKKSALLRQVEIEPSQLGRQMGDKDPAVSIHHRAILLLEPAVKEAELTLNNDAIAALEYKRVNMPQKANQMYQAAPQSTPSAPTNAQKIKELFELYKAGALSEEEYALEKAKILEPSNAPVSNVTTSTPKQDPMEFAIVQKFNQQHGTNLKSIKEIQEHMQNRQ
ncbi:SHOCT domain-containing protein [Sulfurospirillum sp. T05]|jgi:hypothetical protein|uniref:SHOCT domain-containing protein n=1 Tax=Sulfurospirillum tamanense TaxID=2813362 RepID=A0ABS2WUX2_9BACT|nr:SHOCT domain-containing protein [Sulfurospirillum tamanensis]MBN2964989.1 SHOCT domain-containing protein [Sulfurospirillum tamanensis]